MLDFRTFKKGHLDFFQANLGYEGYAEPYADFMDKLGQKGLALSHLIDGKIAYLSAAWEEVPGTFEVLIIPSIHLPKHPKTIIKDIRVWLQYLHEKRGARRIQTWGDPTEVIDRWLPCLGFTCEGTMRQYSIEGDKRIWARLCLDHSEQH